MASRAHVLAFQQVKVENFGARFDATDSAQQAVSHRIHVVFEGGHLFVLMDKILSNY
jgi:hypothetical protein